VNDPLDGPVHARTTDPQTSHDAAASISNDTARTRRYRVLELIRERGPISDDDWFELYLQRWPGSYSYSHRSRRTELRDLGYVRDSGLRKKNPSGREAILWEVTAAGLLADEGRVEAAWEKLREHRQKIEELKKGFQDLDGTKAARALLEIEGLTRGSQSELGQAIHRIVTRTLTKEKSDA